MKIAFFVNAFPMMSEAFIANSAAALIDHGHTVDIYGLGNLEPTGLAVKALEHHGLERITRNARWPSSMAARAIGLPASIQRTAKSLGLDKAFRISPSIYRRSFGDLTAFYQAETFDQIGEYDILHCQFATLSEAVIKHRRAGFIKGAIVVNFRGYDISEAVVSLGPNLYDYVWPEAAGYIANCEYFKNKATLLGCPQDRFEVIGSGIRLEDFPLDQTRVSDTPATRFLMVGRLIERKGFHIALQALARHKAQSLQDVTIDIVGDGHQRDELEKLSGDLGLGDAVTFHGQRPHPYIADLIKKCDVFMAPSLTSSAGGEDAPVNTLKEAMAIGRPVIGTRHGGIPELVIEGQTGFLADQNDVSSLHDAIERTLKNRQSWPDITLNARAKVEEMYELNRNTEKLIKFYERCVVSE